MQIRPATSADIPTLALIGSATLLEAFAGLLPGPALLAHCAKNHTIAANEAHFEHPATRAWLAEVDPQVSTGAAPIGYALLTAPDFPEELVQPGDLELKRIYAFSRFHGTGVGPQLMQHAIDHARRSGAGRLLLGVHPDNARAIAFYRRNGFLEIGSRPFHLGPNIFHDPVFALVL